ncbi:UNVERIFIED_CONTAM: hypothetical protein HDU68_012884, partial [Siphonaria sp. JEL0065]
YTTNNRLKIHSYSHEGKRPYKCAELGCNYSAVQQCALDIHKVKHMTPEQKKQHQAESMRNVPCGLCEKKFKNSKSLDQHMLKEHKY